MNTMKVLWLVSITLPEPSKALGFSNNPVAGWLIGQREQLKEKVSLTICSVDGRVKEPTYLSLEGADYAVLPSGSKDEFAALLENVQPNLVHLWGSENPATAALVELCDPDRLLLSAQGIMTPYTEHLLDGVPEKYCHSTPLQKLATLIDPGELLDRQVEFYKKQSVSEKALLKKLRHVTGRTPWDRAELAKLAPDAAYYVCNETLRPGFFTSRWQGGPQKPVLFLSQGNQPRKGLHWLLQALPPVLEKYPDLTLHVAGWPMVKKGPLLEPLLLLLLPYQTYLKKLMKELNLGDKVVWLGPLNEEAMRAALLESTLFVMPSSLENSPNSLGEAMLLGLPCIATDAGGTNGMIADRKEGILYQPEDIPALTAAILKLLDDPALARQYGEAAHQRAAVTHDPVLNGQAMLHIYHTILGEESAL